jgi:hypothetical protein
MNIRASAVMMLLLTATPPLAQAAARETVPFIENDYSKAVAQAKAKNLPLFVDAWAPW